MNRRKFFLLGLAFASIAAVFGRSRSASQAGVPVQAGRRKVYAHWHWFPTSFDNLPPQDDIYADYLAPDGSNGKFRAEGGYIRERPFPRRPRPEANWAMLDMGDEIKAAHSIGIDGFQFNIGSVEPNSPYIMNLRNMLDAADAGPESFKVVLSLDALILKETPLEPIAAAVLKLASHASVARQSDGRLLLGAFAPEQWEIGRWKLLLERLSAAGEKVSFFPTFLDSERTFEFIELIDGASMWGVDNSVRFGGRNDSQKRRRMPVRPGLQWCGRRISAPRIVGLQNLAIASCFELHGMRQWTSNRMRLLSVPGMTTRRDPKSDLRRASNMPFTT
jgi:hypothetical protein